MQNGPRRQKTPMWKVLLWIVGGIVGVIALFVALGAVYIYSATETPLTAQDREMLVTADEFEYGAFTVNPQHERAVKIEYLDRSYDFEYEYDDPNDPNAPFISMIVTVERKRSDATTGFVTAWASTKAGLNLLAEGDVEIEEQDSLYSWGDASHFALVRVNGQPNGTLFAARKGKLYVTLMLFGLYFDDEISFADLMDNRLARIETNLL